MKIHRVIFLVILPLIVIADARGASRITPQTKLVCQQSEEGNTLFARTRRGTLREVSFTSALDAIKKQMRILRKRSSSPHAEASNTRSALRMKRLRFKRLQKIVLGCHQKGESFEASRNVCDALSSTRTENSPLKSRNPEELGQRILGGQSCKPESIPLVQLLLTEKDGTFRGTCSGTVIADDVILTAAHCLVDGVAKVRIRIGMNFYESNHFEAHPQYDDRILEYQRFDIGVVFASESLPVGRARINFSDAPEVGEYGLIAGYGRDEKRQIGKPKSASALIYDVTKRSIKTIYSDTQINGNTCSGDSGGGLYIFRDKEWRLVGVTSNGVKKDCGKGDISGYANLQSKESIAFLRQFFSS